MHGGAWFTAAAIGVLLSVGGAGVAHADTCSAGTGAWTAGGTWSCGHAPTAADTAVVTNGVVTVPASVDFAGGLRIETDGVLSIAEGATLTASGPTTIDNNAGFGAATIQGPGTLRSTGTFTAACPGCLVVGENGATLALDGTSTLSAFLSGFAVRVGGLLVLTDAAVVHGSLVVRPGGALAKADTPGTPNITGAHVTVEEGGTVSVPTDRLLVASVAVISGDVSGGGTFRLVPNNFATSALLGSATLAPGTALRVAAPLNVSGSPSLDGRLELTTNSVLVLPLDTTLTSTSVLQIDSDDPGSGAPGISGPGTLRSTGTFTAVCPGCLVGGDSGATLALDGTSTLAAFLSGFAAVRVGGTLTLADTARVAGGQVRVLAGGTLTRADTAGTPNLLGTAVNVVAGGTLSVPAGRELVASYSEISGHVSGGGTFRLVPNNFATSVLLGSATLAPGTALRVAAPVNVSGSPSLDGRLELTTNGRLVLPLDTTLTSTSVLQIDSDDPGSGAPGISGPGTLRSTGTFTAVCPGCLVGGESGATLALDGISALAAHLSGFTAVRVGGTLTLADTARVSGGQVRVLAGGTLTKTATDGTPNLLGTAVNVEEGGTLSVPPERELVASYSEISGHVSGGGTFHVVPNNFAISALLASATLAPGTTLRIASPLNVTGSPSLDGQLELKSGGAFSIAEGATVSVSGPVLVDPVGQFGIATISGPGTMLWTGAVSIPGQLALRDRSTLRLDGQTTLGGYIGMAPGPDPGGADDPHLRIGGSMTMADDSRVYQFNSGIDSVVVEVAPGGTLAKADTPGGVELSLPVTNAGTVAVPAGTLPFSGGLTATGGTVTGGGTITGPLTNAGATVSPSAGSTLTLGSLNQTSGATAPAAGETLVTGAHTQSGGSTTIPAGATFTAPSHTFSDASTATVHGTLTGASELLSGAVLRGGGTVGALTNTAGRIAPGASPGVLNVAGDFAQGAAGVLEVELDGTAPGTFDVVAVTGAASLGGTLALLQGPAFDPVNTDTIQILTSGTMATGTFATVTGTPATRGRTLTVERPAAAPFGVRLALALPAVPATTGRPSITGTPATGQTLTCNPGTWTGVALVFTYAWQLDGQPMSPAATGTTYVVREGDAARQITCRETATNGGGSQSAISDPVSPPAPPAPEPAPIPAPPPPAPPAPDAGQLALECDKSDVAVLDIVAGKTKATITGQAKPALAGRKATILIEDRRRPRRFRPVTTATIGPTGAFTATVALPKRAARSTAAYAARVDSTTSRSVELERRMLVTSVRVVGGKLRFSGVVRRPLAAKPARVRILQFVDCKPTNVVATVVPTRRGTFVATAPLPEAPTKAAIYRADTLVPTRAGGRPTNRSFTLPRAVNVR